MLSRDEFRAAQVLAERALDDGRRLGRYMDALRELAKENETRGPWYTVYRKVVSMTPERQLRYFEHLERMAKKELPAGQRFVSLLAKRRLVG